MIIVFLIAANVLGKNEALLMERRADTVSERTQPVGDARVAGEEETAEKTEPEEEQEIVEAEPRSGKEVYNGLCVSCHGTGLPGSPQMGNPDDWTDRIAKGEDTLYDHAINGFTGPEGHLMPAKGGNPALSDEEVRNAVDYMLANSQ